MNERAEKFDRYTIVRVLGKGGMGTVFLANDETLNRQVALKVLNDYDLPSAERRNRFMREARAAAQIRHANVATIYEVGESSGSRPFISMEYCDGEPLSQVIRRESLSTERFLIIGRQIAEGLAAAHRNGVIHRDIKSANIILEPGDHVKILDFGLARIDSVNTSTAADTATGGGFFGTLPYLSPEQARGEQADARSDLFSLGVVLYEMATGVLPFDGESALSLLEKIRAAEPRPFVPIDPEFPRGAADIIAKLLQKRPQDRFASADEVIAAFLDFQDSFRMTARLSRSLSRTSGLRETTGPRPSRKRVALIGIIAAALIAAIVAGFVLRPSAPKQAVSPAGPAAPIKSLAVLPFQNLSQQQSEEFLSIGLADALTTQLQQVSSLSVRPTSAVLEFHGKAADARSAGAKLEVDGVLEGRYLTSGNVVRVSLQLTDTRTGYGVWATNLEGHRENLIDLIDNVSTTTKRALQDKLATQNISVKSEPRTGNAKAFELYLRARSLTGSMLPDDNRTQIDLLRQAIDLDPNFAAAYADLGVALSLQQVRGFSVDPQYNKPEWYARQAVRLDPNLADAHLALGRTLVRVPGRFREATRETLAALRSNPNEPLALQGMVAYFAATGDMQRASCVLDRLVAVNPASNDARTRGYWFVNAVDPDQVMRLAPMALESKETEIAGHDMLAAAHLMRDDSASALAEANKILAINPNHYTGKSVQMLVAANRKDKAGVEHWLSTMKDDVQNNHYASMRVALAYARLGDHASALKWLKKAQEGGNHGWYFCVKHPWMQSLQGDPEFQKIIGAMKADLDDVRDDVIGVYELLCASGRSS